MNQTATATATATVSHNPPITSRDVSPFEMLQAALDYASRGLPVIPIHGVIPLLNKCTCKKQVCGHKAGKHPRTTNGCYDGTIEHKTIKGWNSKHWKAGANVAIVGGRLLIVDVDLHADGADESLAKAELELGTLPRDWMVSTGGGGVHLYFSLPDGVQIGCVNGWRTGVDIKSSGGYGVAPPSLHQSGKRYAWVSQLDDSPPLLPAAWLNELKKIEPSDRAKGTSSTRQRAKRSAPQVDLAETYQELTVNRRAERDSTDKSDKPDTSQILSVLSVQSQTHAKIIEAINLTVPRREGIRNHRLMELGRWFLRIPDLKDKDAEWFRPIIKAWLDQAIQFIGHREFDETWDEWLYIWSVFLTESIESHPVIRASEQMRKRPLPAIPPTGYKSSNARSPSALVQVHGGGRSRRRRRIFFELPRCCSRDRVGPRKALSFRGCHFSPDACRRHP